MQQLQQEPRRTKMSKASKLVKDMVKSKRESVMGKLGDSPFADPMEPWSAKYNSPVKNEEVEKIDEAGTGLLMSYIKAKGVDPSTMDTNKKNAYSKSSEYRMFRRSHRMKQETSGMGERGDDWNEEKKAVKEEVDEKDTVTLDIPLMIRIVEYAREDAKTDMDLHRIVENLINLRHEGVLTMDHYEQIVNIKKIKEDVEDLDEMSGANMDTRALHSHIKKLGWKLSRTTGSHDVFTHPEAKHHISVPRHRQLKAPLVKDLIKQSKITEGVEQIDELKKMPDNMDADDHITREDLRKWFSKTDPEGDWKRINSKGEVAGPCAREPGEPKPKCMSKEKRSQLSKSERASAVAAKRKHDPNPERKGKPINVSNYGKGKLSEDSIDEACWDTHKQVGMKKKGGKMVPDCVPKNEEVEQIDEKNKPTNPKLWSRAVSMARSKFSVYPSAYANGWASKWYKSKGGGWKSVKEEVLDEQGLGNKETSPMAATDSVKAMESSHRSKQMKSARIIKSIYKKKVRETMYDWEKDDKGGKTPNAKIVLTGGKTMTGKDRDTVEIDPVLRTRPNLGKPTV
jgi:predicted RNA binding protein YcfA (HicA-like mRNA interferase family)